MTCCRKWMLIIFVVLTAGCATGRVQNWGQFHGNLANQGVQHLKSGYALSAAWISPRYPITSSSPVIGFGLNGGEVLYVGTVDAHLLAIDTADGSLLWRRRLQPGGDQLHILSSPAVAENGDIYVLASRRSGYGRLHTRLFKFDKLGFRRWEFSFHDDVFTTGSPKVAQFQGRTLIFVHVAVLGAESARGELHVLEDEGVRAGERSRAALNDCSRPLQETSSDAGGFLREVENFWRIAAAPPGAAFGGGFPESESFLLPTPALVCDDRRALIAVVDNLCGLGVFRWDGEHLTAVWQNTHDGQAHSSPAILPNSLLVFGRRDGTVQAFDLLTGAPRWSYDAGEPVLATPAGSTAKFVFVVSRQHLHRLDAETGKPHLSNGAPKNIELAGHCFGSAALTLNRVYVSGREMLTVSLDMQARGHDTSFRGNGLGTAALGTDGSVYAVAGDGAIHKYQGTR